MKQAEIEFCDMWRACSTGADAPTRSVVNWVIPRRHQDGVGCGLWEGAGLMHRETRDEPHHITPRGADLLASYEHALAHGMPIVTDDCDIPPILTAVRRRVS